MIRLPTIILTIIISLFTQVLSFPLYENRDSSYKTIPIVEINSSRSQYYFDSAYLFELETPTWLPLIDFYYHSGHGFLKNENDNSIYVIDYVTGQRLQDTNNSSRFYFQDMDLRPQYILHPLRAEEMILRAVNYHRFENQRHSYTRLRSISLAAIYHSINQRDVNQTSQRDFDGRTHQERMEMWSERERNYVRSSHVSHHQVNGEFNQDYANQIIDQLMTTGTADWLMRGYYHNLGVGVGIQENGIVRLTIHMATEVWNGARNYHQTHVHGYPGRERTYEIHNDMAREAFLYYHGENAINPYR